jgi:tetratricopeptide (TPR) repeat protein
MKVQCNQCGKMFRVPDSQAHRSLKCVCKNIFLAVPVLEEIVDEKPGEPAPAVEPPKPPSPFEQMSFDPNEEVSSANDETEEGLKDYVDFLKNSRTQTHTQESEPPKTSATPLKSFELADEPKPPMKVEEEIPLTQELVSSGPINSQSSPSPQQRISASNRISSVERSIVRDRNSDSYPKRPAKKAVEDHRRAVTLAIVGVFSIALVSVVIYWPQKPIEEIQDPYLTQLLTPQDSTTVTPSHRIHTSPSTPESKPVVKPKAEVVVAEEPVHEPRATVSFESATYRKMRQALLNGDYENVVRLGSAVNHLEDEEAALFFEALFERAGDKVQRHQDLYKKLQDEKSQFPNSSALIRTSAFAMIKDPSGDRSIPRAIEILKSLQLTRSDDPFVFAYLGRAYERVDRMDLAHRYWEQALSLEPNFVWILQVRDQFYRSEKKFNLAMGMAEHLSKVPNHELEGYKRMGEVAELKNDGNSAVHFYRKALKIQDSAELHIQIGDILLETNQEGALREFEAGLRAKPSRMEKRDIYIRIGRNQCDQQNYQAALQAFKKAFAEDAHSIKIAIEKSRCELSAKSYKAAANTLENALKLNPNSSQLWQDYGYALLHQDKLKPAFTAIKRAIELKPSDQAYFLMAQVHMAMKKRPEAQMYLRKAIQLNPKNREAKALLKQLN